VPADSVSIRIYSGIARFPCDSMAFLLSYSMADITEDDDLVDIVLASCNVVLCVAFPDADMSFTH